MKVPGLSRNTWTVIVQLVFLSRGVSSVPSLRSPVFGPKSFSVPCLRSPVCFALPIASRPACSGCSSSAGRVQLVRSLRPKVPGARPKVPGARRGPQGAENPPKTRGRIYHVILPEVCPVWVPESILAGFVWHDEVALEMVCRADFWCKRQGMTSQSF